MTEYQISIFVGLLCTAHLFLFLFTGLSLSFGSASVSELAMSVEANLVSVRSLQKISALFDLCDRQFKLHFSGLKCLVSVLTAKHLSATQQLLR